MTQQPLSKDEIFNAAAEIEDSVQREEFLDQACSDDTSLRQEIEDLLRRDREAGSFLESSPSALRETADYRLTQAPGTQIGPYKLLQKIGEGGMGVVYMAEQKKPVRRRVALKIIKPGMDTRQVVARFEAERQALAMMDHPSIAKVLDAGQTDSNRPYFVMELVDGISITEYCDQQHLSTRERLELFVPICQAVQHAHQKGIIHRDLKPSNVLVAFYDNQAVPKVIDFGVAKATTQVLTEKTMFTQLGQAIGTLEYMSPEQAQRNQLDIDTRSDIYSLGVLLYELLTGETPFDSRRLRSAAYEEMLRIIREEDPPKPSTKLSSSASLPSIAAKRHVDPNRLTSMVRGELDWIVMKALEKDRSRRYETATKLADDIHSYLNDEPITACPPSATYRVRKFVRRNRLQVMMCLGAALLVLVGLTTTLLQLNRAVKAEQTALDLLAAEQAAKAEASDQAQQARAQEQALETVLTFLTDDVLAQADPAENTDRDLTVRQAVDRASENIEGRFQDQPVVEARLRETLGMTYLGLADYAQAMRHFNRALELCGAHPGIENESAIAAINNVASAYEYRGEYDLAEPLFRKAWTAMKDTYGEGNENTLICLNNLAWSIRMQGRLDEAIPLFNQVLQKRQQTLGESHPDTLVSMNDLASVYFAQGRYAECEPLMTAAATKLRETKGLGYPDTLRCMHNLAMLRRAQRRFDDAEKTLRQVLESRRKVLNENHPSTLATQHCLAWTYQDLDRVSEAEKEYLDVIRRRREHVGPWHADTFTSLNNLAELYLDHKRPKEAESLLRECQAILEHNQVKNWQIRRTMSRLGESLLRQAEQATADDAVTAEQQRIDAQRLLLDAFQKQESARERSERIKTIERLVQLYASWGKRRDVEQWQSTLSQHIESESN